MTLANPAALWLATLMIPIIALHILRAQRTEIVVSSTLEWESIDRPVAAARPWQRLRMSLPLLLQLLLVGLLTAELAGPSLSTGRVSAQHVIFLVDTSASMGGTDGAPTRLDDARDAIQTELSNIGAGAEISIIAAGAPAQIIASEVPPSEVANRLDQLEVSEGGFDATAAGSLALSLDRPDRSVQTVLISDGGLNDAAIRQLPSGTDFVPVGRSDRNIGVTNIVVTTRGNTLHAQAEVTNAGERTVTAVVRFDVDGRTITTNSIKVPGGETVETAADLVPGERIEVLIDGDDLLRLDDHAYAAGPELTGVRTLVVGPADPFLNALLGSNPSVAATFVDEAALIAGGPELFADIDMAVFNQVNVPSDIGVPYFAIAPPNGTPAVIVDGSVDNPIPTLIRDDVDLLSGVDLSSMALASAQKITAAGSTTLIGAEGAPLLVSGRAAASPFIYLAAPLAQTNLGLLPAFPVLGDRILSDLGRTDLVGGDLHPGDPLVLDASSRALVTSPTGTEIDVEPGTAAPALDRTGFWTVDIKGQGTRTIVVNPDPAETDVAPTAKLAIPGVVGGLDGDGEPVTRSIVGLLIGLGLLVLVGEWLVSRRRRGVSLRQWRWAEIARIGIATLLLIALLAPSFHRSAHDVATIFVVDVSDSVSASRAQVNELVAEALESQDDGSVAGVVIVGAQARVDSAVAEKLAWSAPRAVVDGSATDLAAGLRVAGALAPTDHARRIVMVSDGRPTVSSRLAVETSRLSDAGIKVESMVVDPTFGADISVTSVDAPARARPNDDIEITVNVMATAAQTATVSLFRDGAHVDQTVIEAPAGQSTATFVQPAGDSASVSWTARVGGPNNGIFENDEARAGTRIDGRPTVLVVEGVSGNSATLTAALDAAGIMSTVIEPETLGGLDQLGGVDAVILVNVSAGRLSADQTAGLSRAVRNLGVGLLAVGGTSSFGAADYLGTPLEELLPVISEAKDPKRRSKVAEVFAVDTSGSMGACHCADDADGSNSRLEGGVTKTDIARDSAVRSLEGFQPTDEIGVLALDDRQRWIMDLQPVGNGDGARKQMSEIEHSERPTNLDASLTASAAKLRESDATLRHIVLFTDGFTDTAKLRALASQAEKLREEGITVSVMGTGEGAARSLRDIADAGGGRYYAGRDLKELPDLLLEETRVVARQLIVEGSFLPQISSVDPVVAALTSAPPIEGYLATTAKPTATQHLRVGDEKDPLLASWRVGLGEAAVWTSDAGTRWSKNWAGWDGYVTFWSDVVRSILPSPAGEAEIRFEGATANITAAFDTAVPDGANVVAEVVDPAGESQTIQLQRLDDTAFSGSVEVGPAGVYGVGVTATVGGESIGAITANAELGFSREYLAQGADRGLLESLSSQTGGRGLIRPREAFDSDGLTPGRIRIDLRNWLILAALLVWPFTIALSRLRRSAGALEVAGLRKRTDLGDLASTIMAGRGASRGASATKKDEPPRPKPTQPSGQAPPPRQPPPQPGSPPESQPPNDGSSIDSLLAAKRKRQGR